MSEYRPGKGLRIPLDAGLADWLTEVMGNIADEIEMAAKSRTAESAVVTEPEGELSDWESDSDKYGSKVSTSYDLESGGQVKVTVIATPEGKLRLDIREWFQVK